MISNILKHLIAALVLSLVLLTVGLLIWYFMKDADTSLQDILFWVGAAPIAFFSIRRFGNFRGRADPSYQLSRTVSNQSPIQSALQDADEIKSMVRSDLNWFIAGLLIWLYLYFAFSYSS